jgi:Flp pilus assembly protein TadD
MGKMDWRSLAIGACLLVATGSSPAKDLKISIPRHSSYTPVQRLNRDGVEAIRKRDYQKAKELFYKAYLYDPDDPFTLNNLGYISELEGQLERALQFYSLASQQNTDAIVDRASSPEVEGESLRDEMSGVHDRAVQVNLGNVHAVRLLSEGRAFEADTLLQRTLTLEPRNPFTLNNLGVAKEMQGELSQAASYYTAAAASRSSEPIVVTANDASRGKEVSEVAAQSAKKVLQRLRRPESRQARAAEFNLRGVAAANRNDWKEAERDFREAYALDPNNAFSMNNAGYLAELYGDRETAEFFYQKAREAPGARNHIGLATDQHAKGLALVEVAADNDQKVDAKMAEDNARKRRQPSPIQLKRRDGMPVTEPVEEVPRPPSAQ